MKIVVLDGFTLNPGDLSWGELSDRGAFSCFDRSLEGDILPRSLDADILFTNKTPLTADTLERLPKLKYIGVLATGTNVVDLAAAREAGIIVTNVPGYGPDAVAQMVFAHILHHTQQVSAHHGAVRDGLWSRCDDFCFTLSPLQSLQGKVLGLIGYGDIGRRVAQIGLAFGMSVLVNTRSALTDLPEGIRWGSLAHVLQSADVLSLHCPLSSATEKLIHGSTLAMMKPGAILINTARGGLIDERALADALNQGQIAFAGVDVLSSEPPSSDNPLLTARNVSITPHNAWATREARQRLLSIAIANLDAFLEGKPVNRV